VSSLSERTLGLAGRLNENPRALQEVSLLLVDGTEVRGVLHRTHGTRTLDFLNYQAESFIAFTGATLVSKDGEVEHVSFVAVNKQHILRVIEANNAD
jgi:hypothetical protein